MNGSETTPSLRQNPEFVFDVTEVSRQLLANRFLDKYSDLEADWNSTTATSVDIHRVGSEMIDILRNLDALLYTNDNYLLSTWIADAKQWSNGNASYEAYLEYQARNQITLWGPTAGLIDDYAGKQWAGLVGEYYLERWETFISMLGDWKQRGEPYNATTVAERMEVIGEQFDGKRWGEEPGEVWGTKGDVWDVVNDIITIWA